jgi:RNA polymerase sigma-32 factor
MGIEPTSQLIAERLNVPERDVISMDMRLASGDASLDAPVGTAEGRSVARVEILPSNAARADDTLADAEVGDRFSQKIHEFGNTLKGKEKKIFEERLVSEDPKTLQTLGDDFGVSRERVRQIEKRLLQKLKAYLRDELGETVVEVYEAT